MAKKKSPKSAPSGVRNRVVEHRRMKAADLLANPANWRTHPPEQTAALRGILEEVGQVGGLLAYHSERQGGALTIIDGHLRAGMDPAQEWDVAITDLTDAEADKVLLTHDPLAAMAVANQEALDSLAAQAEFANEALLAMVAEMTEEVPDDSGGDDDEGEDQSGQGQVQDVPERFEVVVECKGESHQRELFMRLTGEGLACRVLTV